MLSRLLITGKIDFNTPLCIILEIADAHGINYDTNDLDNKQYIQELIDIINYRETLSITFPIYLINDWEILARFINKSVSWSQNLLIDAYKYLSSFNDGKDLIDKISTDFTVGIQTPENIHSINPCILFKICKDLNVTITFDTTIEQLYKAVYYLKCDKSLLINKVTLSIRKFNKCSLIDLLINNDHLHYDNEDDYEDKIDYYNIPNQQTTYEDLLKLENRISDNKYLKLMVAPKTNEGAIILAATNYYIDISKSKSSMDEYIELRNKGLNYKPLDKWFKYWYEKNYDLFDLRKTFNPLFPRKIYDQTLLLNLAISYGYNPKDKIYNNPYEFLQVAYTSETFYHGLLPLTKREATIIDLDEFSDIPYGQLLSYGQIDVSLKPITISELIDLFNANQNFTWK